MNAQTLKSSIAGPAGALEIAVDAPLAESRGVAVIAHPHPLFSGTMDNKVVQTLARAFAQCGWTTVRFNFRGAGASAGVHDDGRGELDDFLAVAAHAATLQPGGSTKPAFALAGFSFGAGITTHAFERLRTSHNIEKLVLVGTSVARTPAAPIDAAEHLKTLVIHGELDDTVLLKDVLDWARPQALPVTVVPGGEHFFHGQLPLLKNLVIRHLSSSMPA